MQGSRVAWKEVAWIFGLSRLVIILVSSIGIVLFPQAQQIVPTACTVSFAPCFTAWYRWDAIAYVNIAHHGYTYLPDTAFFPFWPLIEHFGGILLGGLFPDSYYFAGLIIANICFYFVLVLLYRLLVEDFEADTARRALFYIAFSPYAIFFFLGYTESLFLLLSIGIFLLLRRGNPLDWWLAGLLGFFAMLTRSSGMILTIPYLVIHIQRFWIPSERAKHSWKEKLNALAPLLLIPAGVLVYMLYLGLTTGNPLMFISQEGTFHWHRHLTFPWVGIFAAFSTVFTSLNFDDVKIQNLLDLSFTLIPLTILILGWRRIPLHYALFALALILFTLCFPQSTEPLASQPRYMLVIFPIIAILAFWGKRPRFNQAVIVFILPLFAINMILFISHRWVA
jgi:Mannosyltransferase (PIG-V)